MTKIEANKKHRAIIEAVADATESLTPEEKLDLRLTASFCLWVEEMRIEHGVIPDLSFIEGKLLAKEIKINQGAV